MNLDWVGAGLGIGIAVAGSRWFVPWLAVRYGFRADALQEPAHVASSGNVLRDLSRVQRSVESQRRALAGFDAKRCEVRSMQAGGAIGFAVALAAFVLLRSNAEQVGAFSTAPGAVLLMFSIPDTAWALTRVGRASDLRPTKSLFRLGLALGFMAIGVLAGPIPGRVGGIGVTGGYF